MVYSPSDKSEHYKKPAVDPRQRKPTKHLPVASKRKGSAKGGRKGFLKNMGGMKLGKDDN